MSKLKPPQRKPRPRLYKAPRRQPMPAGMKYEDYEWKPTIQKTEKLNEHHA